MVPFAKTCEETGKKGYTSRANAKTALRSIGGRGMSAYRCASCDYWHVGHNGGKPREFHRGWHAHHEQGTLTGGRS